MKLLKVSPITKVNSKDLFYFSAKDIKPGAIVSIQIRKKECLAVVLSVANTKDLKTGLRKSAYSLKKVSKVIEPESFFRPLFLKTIQKTADYFSTNTGSIIKEICPKSILENPPPNETKPQLKTSEVQSRSNYPTQVIQSPKTERIRFYKNLIRSEFAKKQTVFFCVPSVQEVEYFEEKLKKGVEKFVFSFHGKMSKKSIRDKWKEATQKKHPILIIATGTFLSIQKPDTKTFILENEGSSFYKSQNRPFVDTREIIKSLAIDTNSSLILADEITRKENYSKASKIISTAKQKLVDMTKCKTIISEELREMLESAHKKNERSIIFINRRGYSLSTVCNDCGSIIKCPNCDSPLVLHNDLKKNYICHKCVSKIKPGNCCPYCKGWKLKTLGYGIQKITEEISEMFPDFKIFRLDSDIAKTQKQRKEIIKKYKENTGSILVTTEVVLNLFEDTIENIGVVSIDNLFNIPDFRINEKIFRLLLKLKTKASKNFLIQSRLVEHPIFKNVIKGDIEGFYKSEIMSRKILGYPPFRTLIKIIRESKDKAQAENDIKNLEKEIEDYEPANFTGFTPKMRGLHRSYLLLKLGPGWPYEYKKLHQILSSLPPQWKIDVDPENLL